uniref:DUF641 domain-containing protein n=1 Tax=Musa acuminata subsp. malaccensis TaxID=214687 RepID=A0A804L115_MUSAM
MEPSRAAPPPPNFGSVARTITKILRLRRSAASSTGGSADAAPDDYDAIHKFKLARDVRDYSGILTEPPDKGFHKPEDEKRQLQQQKSGSSGDLEAMESLLANLFASISAVKAAYAELQVAQSSYDSELIQSADGAVVAGLKHISVLKQSFFRNQFFVQLMVKEMDSAGWDLDTAAGSIQPDVLREKEPSHRTFAFESYVCLRMFSDLHHQNFGIGTLEECLAWDRRQFFNEFTRLKSIAMNQSLGGLPSGRGFPGSEFFAAFAEMSRRMWLLHCLFFSFEPDTERSIFQVGRGSRFSDVYMESVTAAESKDKGGVGGAEGAGSGRGTAVGFTVVPGFKVGRTLIQSKVYLITVDAKVNLRL